MTAQNTYPDFNFEAPTLSAYILSLDTFIISLKNGRVIHHVPVDADKFEHWLLDNKIRNVR